MCNFVCCAWLRACSDRDARVSLLSFCGCAVRRFCGGGAACPDPHVGYISVAVCAPAAYFKCSTLSVVKVDGYEREWEKPGMMIIPQFECPAAGSSRLASWYATPAADILVESVRHNATRVNNAVRSIIKRLFSQLQTLGFCYR